MYLHYGNEEAVEALASSYRSALETHQHAIVEHNKQIDAEVRRLQKRNRAIRRKNAQLQTYNEAHPDTPMALLEQLVIPSVPPLELDLSALIAEASTVGSRPLPLLELVERLTHLVKASEASEVGLHPTYLLAYRGLSLLGAHPTLWAVNAYIDYTPNKLMVRTTETMSKPQSMGWSVIHTGLMITALLGARALSRRDCDTPICDAVLERYAQSDLSDRD